jgi:hypothetical protein
MSEGDKTTITSNVNFKMPAKVQFTIISFFCVACFVVLGFYFNVNAALSEAKKTTNDFNAFMKAYERKYVVDSLNDNGLEKKINKIMKKLKIDDDE